MRRVFPSFLLITGLLLLTNGSVAQGPVDSTEILARAANALGVQSGAIQTITATGTTTKYRGETSATHPFKLSLVGLKKARWEVGDPSSPVTTVVMGGRGWVESATKRNSLPLSQISGRTAEFMPALALSQWLQSSRVKVKYLGLDDSTGGKLHHFEIRHPYEGTAPPDFQAAYEQVTRCEIFVTPDSYQMVRLRFYIHNGDWRRDFPVDLIFSNFTPVHGVLVPMQIERRMGGRKVAEISFQTISFNENIPDSAIEGGQ